MDLVLLRLVLLILLLLLVYSLPNTLAIRTVTSLTSSWLSPFRSPTLRLTVVPPSAAEISIVTSPTSTKPSPLMSPRLLAFLSVKYDKGEIVPETYYPAVANPPSPNERTDINRRISTGVRAIDSLLTVGKGQRLGIFAGSGVGTFAANNR